MALFCVKVVWAQWRAEMASYQIMIYYNGEFVSLTINICKLFLAPQYALEIWTEATQLQFK